MVHYSRINPWKRGSGLFLYPTGQISRFLYKEEKGLSKPYKSGHERRICTFKHLILRLSFEPSSALEVPKKSTPKRAGQSWQCRVTSAHGDFGHSACGVSSGLTWKNGKFPKNLREFPLAGQGKAGSSWGAELEVSLLQQRG